MFCKNCGKEIDDDSNVCKHCGTAVAAQPDPQTAPQPQIPQPSAPQPQTAGKKNILGLIGFILSLVSFFLDWYSILAVGALVCSIIGMTQRKDCTDWNKLTVAGLVCSIVSISLYFILTLIGVSIFNAFLS